MSVDDISTWIQDWTERDLEHLTLVVGWRVGSRIESARVPTSQDVADVLLSICVDRLGALLDLEPKPWSSDMGVEDEEYPIATLDQLGDDNPVLAAFQADDFNVIHPATLADRNLLFYALIVGPNDGRLVFLRKYNPRRALRNRLVAIFTDTLSRVEDPLFTFDERIDLILDLGRGAAILNLGAFELLFRTSPEMLSRIPRYVEDIAGSLPIDRDSVAVLTDAAKSQARLRRRLQSITDRGHLANVTITDLRREIRRLGMDPREFIRQNQLSITAANVAQVFLVLNEDLFQGGLSKTSFQVDRKRPT